MDHDLFDANVQAIPDTNRLLKLARVQDRFRTLLAAARVPQIDWIHRSDYRT
jgi:hypothetical protein